MSEAKWYGRGGESGEVVSSTRVRLARNLKRLPFPDRAGPEEREQVAERVRDAMENSNSVLSKDVRFMDLEELSREEAVSLVERRLVSPEFISERQGRALLLSSDESISIMINEEDHLRIQVLREGQALSEALETADRIDTLLSERLEYAYDRDFGYLTQCPTNLGTGMRASLTLHLPGLTESGSMGRIGENLSKLGMALRGAFGEGTKAVGEMYQLSNQITLGLSERQAIENLASIAGQLIEQERRLRKAMLSTVQWQDQLSRAAGILGTARLMSGEEATRLLSLVRLGISEGRLSGVELGAVNGLAVEVQPATLMAAGGRQLSPEDRDRLRADILRDVFKNIKVL